MNRRTYLLGLAAPLSGCTAGYRASIGPGDGEPARQARRTVELGSPATLCEEAIDPGDIHPITEPEFGADWQESTVPDVYGTLSEETVVVGLTDGDRSRAYPIRVLWQHEAVNDDFGGPVLVTYCGNCRSGMVADRRIDGTVTRFAASGLLWRPPREYAVGREDDGTTFGATSAAPTARIRNSGNLVLYDADTESYWSQLLAEALCGPRAGWTLSIRPSRVATWADWRADNPDTEVLLPPPASGTVPRL